MKTDNLQVFHKLSNEAVVGLNAYNLIFVLRFLC